MGRTGQEVTETFLFNGGNMLWERGAPGDPGSRVSVATPSVTQRRMHPRNPYRTPPNFTALAESYPELQCFLKKTSNGVGIDFQDEAAQRCLTRALLHRDFALSLELPIDRLCPPVPNRLNYILWIEDILSVHASVAPACSEVAGVDIGTGASAIYPLLGCRIGSKWRFWATEVDQQSAEFARRNVTTNNLSERIMIVQVRADDSIFPAAAFQSTQGIDFTMCNPPFYGSREEVLSSAEAKEIGPSGACTGAETEMITPGGEVAFVRKMVQESLQLRESCRWYTSMLGKMSSLTEIVQSLRSAKANNYAITEFVQGKTRRWAIAWSFGDLRLPDSLARISNATLQSIMPARNTLRQAYTQFQTAVETEQALLKVLNSIDGVTVAHRDAAASGGFLVNALQNTWSRAARRRKLTAADSADEHQPTQPALVCRVRCTRDTAGAKREDVVEFDWVQGRDRGLFESFMSHVARKLDTLAKNPDVEMG
ncbi:S-adenosyl-L-methionine dependent methyltransferase [Phanerochaete sordida]|uniref:S-adenosyl-L-methionine dependent methyltransferase n=1 Tax=Phanerochaete sordida TaxID=48140 RepID=A0A9P3LFQ1_9APHY|nr:S-adenosyl-L-methionine dependent methyltransferase [Phanerochaete sordida]